ncbi:DUF484 family protein [Sneathiella marina]|uniref:DUF484 family protein n=1 Tax=Sneathiella marina TaxID=2950108 RepID=A0ABY4W4D2_9PROT|nr:DUF484 family protein [Sneathiella marina]USG61679.1 DUF484 family protein [Sneathiella marina]
MSKKSDSKTENLQSRIEDINEEDVRNWLISHPDFLSNNAGLLAPSLPSERVTGDGVIDMQSVLVNRLQKEIADLSAAQNEFIKASRANSHTQNMVHASVKAILSATSLNHFVHILTQDLPELLEIDVITLCIEDGPVSLPEMTGLQRLKEGSIERANWHGREIILRAVAPKSKAIFGPAKDLVHSDALIKLDVPSLHANAMIAFGSRESDHFQQDQGTELLTFLAITMQSCLQMWLEQKSD